MFLMQWVQSCALTSASVFGLWYASTHKPLQPLSSIEGHQALCTVVLFTSLQSQLLWLVGRQINILYVFWTSNEQLTAAGLIHCTEDHVTWLFDYWKGYLLSRHLSVNGHLRSDCKDRDEGPLYSKKAEMTVLFRKENRKWVFNHEMYLKMRSIFCCRMTVN